MPNYLVRFQSPNEKGQCNNVTRKRKGKLYTQRLIKREGLATRQEELLSAMKNVSASLN